jgi:hypothetical protein
MYIVPSPVTLHMASCLSGNPETPRLCHWLRLTGWFDLAAPSRSVVEFAARTRMSSDADTPYWESRHPPDGP